jgi:hypothetical protein
MPDKELNICGPSILDAMSSEFATTDALVRVNSSGDVVADVGITAPVTEALKWWWGDADGKVDPRTDAELLALVGGTSETLVMGTIELGHATDTTLARSAAGVMSVEGVPLFPNIPMNSLSAAKTFTVAEMNQAWYHPSADTSARTWTIDSNTNAPAPVGNFITFVNDTSGGVITIAITSDTLVWAGTGGTGSRALAANGIATAVKMTSTRWMISGTGLT